jgi:hypothetical protein
MAGFIGFWQDRQCVNAAMARGSIKNDWTEGQLLRAKVAARLHRDVGGGGRGGQDYSSPVVVNGKMYHPTAMGPSRG